MHKKEVIKINRKRRCPHQIISEIIQSTRKPRQLSDIVFDSRTNFKQANEYIKQLVKAGLLKKSHTINGYEATKKGMQYLATYEELEELLL
jgi:predicted transcriptional regulator